MTLHFSREAERLRTSVLRLCAMVEESVSRAGLAIQNMDRELVNSVIAGDAEIDRMEVDIEEDCLKILALHQPVATDLRFVVAVLKINNDLERIGDHAVSIAKWIRRQVKHGDTQGHSGAQPTLQRVRRMLRKAVDALIQRDADQAREVCHEDQAIDDYYRETRLRVERCIASGGSTTPDVAASGASGQRLIDELTVARHLERMGDLATNIAEDIIYMIEGDIVRHKDI